MAYLSVTAMPDMKKKISQFTGDLNGDGYIDLVIADRTNYRDLFGFAKVFFGTAEGVSTTPGWTYKCDRSNFLESQYFVSIIGDVNGDGMDEEALNKINNNDYFTTRGTANEQGTGLGLMLCKEFLEKNKGQLHIESEKGKGSVFSFTLPRTNN